MTRNIGYRTSARPISRKDLINTLQCFTSSRTVLESFEAIGNVAECLGKNQSADFSSHNYIARREGRNTHFSQIL